MQALRDCRTAREREDTIEAAMVAADGNVTRAAGLLGASRRHLTRILSADPNRQEASEPDAGDDPLVRVSIDMPTSMRDWLELEAVRRKQRDRLSRIAKSPIVIELVRRAMVAESQAEANPGPGSPGISLPSDI